MATSATPLISHLLWAPPSQPGFLGDLCLLGARLYAGITIGMAGFDKLPVPDWMVDQVSEVGFPLPGFFAWVACYTEAVGGLLLTVGLLTRPMALLLGFTMAVAAFGYQDQIPILGGIHVAQLLFWLFVCFLALGGGRLSMDALLTKQPGTRTKPWGPVVMLTVLLFAVANGFGIYRSIQPIVEVPVPAADEGIRSISIPGDFNEWDLTALEMERLGGGDTWSAELVVSGPTPIAFKFAANGSWERNVGDNDQDGRGFPLRGQGEVNGENIVGYLPEAGRYRLEIDAGTFSYRLDQVERE
ncbi:DoxX family membrane protein [Mucisphaera sp.]|uniref:DoxX family membrane protein n=1 Tax=Mucisphaera sp. TaxID=2913024 RepID=UPI003D0BAF5A